MRFGRLRCEPSLPLTTSAPGSDQIALLHQQLCNNLIKIDLAFVGKGASICTDQLVIRSIAHTASELGGRTVAEGVEDEARAMPQRRGVDDGEGYLLGVPAPLSDQIVSATTGNRCRLTSSAGEGHENDSACVTARVAGS